MTLSHPYYLRTKTTLHMWSLRRETLKSCKLQCLHHQGFRAHRAYILHLALCIPTVPFSCSPFSLGFCQLSPDANFGKAFSDSQFTSLHKRLVAALIRTKVHSFSHSLGLTWHTDGLVTLDIVKAEFLCRSFSIPLTLPAQAHVAPLPLLQSHEPPWIPVLDYVSKTGT